MHGGEGAKKSENSRRHIWKPPVWTLSIAEFTKPITRILSLISSFSLQRVDGSERAATGRGDPEDAVGLFLLPLLHQLHREPGMYPFYLKTTFIFFIPCYLINMK